MPITTGVVAAGSLPVAAKWQGVTGDDIFIEVIGDISGITYTLTQPTGGAANPDVQDALDQIGERWITYIVNCMNYDDTDAISKYEVFNEGRWNAQFKKPIQAVVAGSTDDTITSTIAITSAAARKDQKTIEVLYAPNSPTLPFEVAAAAVAQQALVGNDNPAKGYIRKAMPGITPGSDIYQLDTDARQNAVVNGTSTTEIRNGQVVLSDVITTNNPEGVTTPAYRFVVNNTKLANYIFNVNLEFDSDKWLGSPLVTDGDIVTNPDAKKPQDYVTAMKSIHQALGEDAILSNVAENLATITATIDSQNPDRVNVESNVELSGNARVQNVQTGFGFYFGGNS
jgi:phage tail sheath gpL-like